MRIRVVELGDFLPLGIGADALSSGLQGSLQIRRKALPGRLQSRLGQRQFLRADDAAAIEAVCVLDQRGIATATHRRDDLGRA